MRVAALCVAVVLCVVVVAATVPIKNVDHDLHRIAREIKDSPLSLAAKREQLSNLKEMDRELKAYATASHHRREKIKADLKARMVQLHESLHPLAVKGSVFEENDNNDDNDNAKSSSMLVQKVQKDAGMMRNKLQEASLDAETREMLNTNLDAIVRNANQLATVDLSGDQASRLKKAIQLRMRALHLALEEGKRFADEDYGEHPSLDLEKQDGDNQQTPTSSTNTESNREQQRAKITDDIANIEAAVAESDLPVEERHKIVESLNQVRDNAKKLVEATAENHAALSNEIMHSLEQVKDVIGSKTESKPHFATKEEAQKIVKVTEDMMSLREAIVHNDNFEPQMKTDMLNNLEGITQDAIELSTAPESRIPNLSQALKLRVQALREQYNMAKSHALEQQDNGDGDNADDDDDESKKQDLERRVAGLQSKIDKLKKAVRTMGLPADLEREVNDNVRHMEQDLARVHRGENVVHMQKALTLRLQAMKELLEDV